VLEALLVVCVVFFVVAQARIVVLAVSVKRRPDTSAARDLRLRTTDAAPRAAEWPSVVVQLPVYRESQALPRLLEGVLRLDYPPGRLAVQVLDDTDDDAEQLLIRRIVEDRGGRGIPISYVHRDVRTGYKSGALNAGTALLDCDLVAIFDADFVPDPDYLRRTVPRLEDARVVCAHSRWRHSTDRSGPLAALQSAVLDSLFCFESALREDQGESSMYLGTCGVWRRAAVVELGGWKEAPFTDDGIDLSFRARSAGRVVVFVDEALASADLPGSWVAYKNQQRRWARGAFRLFLDYGSSALGKAAGGRRHFLELSSLHLVLSTPVLVVAGLLAAIQVAVGLPRTPLWIGAVIAVTVALVLFPPVQECILSQRALYRDWVSRSLRLIAAIPLALGIAVSIIAGFCDTLARAEPEFVRTPKQGAAGIVTATRAGWNRVATGVTAVELALGLVFAAGAILAMTRGYPEAVFLLVALGIVCVVSVARTTVDLVAARPVAQAASHPV
jgi:cellulose synthase/poly-beta-1,6-N-acetylglucosamine synthase-like glycosyltransferase